MRLLPAGFSSFLAAVAAVAFPACPLASDWSSEVRVGYDYFAHDYRLIEQDTTNTYSEGNVRVRLGYRPPADRGSGPWGLADFFLGKDYWQGDFEIEKEFSDPASWSWRGELSGRQYRSTSDLSYSNDHLQGEARVRYRRPLARSLELEISDRVHGIGYSERTSYLYDSYLNDAGVSLRIGDLLSNSLDLEMTHRTLWVPDSTSISYASDVLTLDYLRMPGLAAMITGQALLDSRRYPSGSLRSDFLRADANVFLERGMSDRVSIEAEAEVRAEWYETVDPIYLNSQTYRIQVGPGFQITDRLDVKVLPGAEIYNISDYEDPSATLTEEWIYIQESYREVLIEFASDYLRLPAFWCDVSARVGHRDYEFSDEALDSDYWYLDLTFLADLEIFPGTHLSVTGLFSPEKHRDPEDNTAINVLSAWIGYKF